MTTTARTTKTARPPMTASDAVSFSGFSISSELQVNWAIKERRESGIHADCSCRAYDDVFTFNRWIAQGSAVVKGEKAMHVSSFVPVGDKATDGKATDGTGERQRMIPKNLFLFCRCQVAPIAPRAAKGGK